MPIDAEKQCMLDLCMTAHNSNIPARPNSRLHLEDIADCSHSTWVRGLLFPGSHANALLAIWGTCTISWLNPYVTDESEGFKVLDDSRHRIPDHEDGSFIFNYGYCRSRTHDSVQ